MSDNVEKIQRVMSLLDNKKFSMNLDVLLEEYNENTEEFDVWKCFEERYVNVPYSEKQRIKLYCQSKGVFPPSLLVAIAENQGWKIVIDEEDEPLLNKSDENGQYIAWPIVFHQVRDHYKKQQQMYWQAEEVEMSKDKSQWKQLGERLTQDAQKYLLDVLLFFVSADNIVADNHATRFMQDLARWEVKMCLGWQIMMEGIHAETYVKLAINILEVVNENDENVLKDPLSVIKDTPWINLKSDWAKHWMRSFRSFPERVVAFIAVEGIFFSSSFCAIGWIKLENLLHGVTYANDKISTDEGAHVITLIMILRLLKAKIPDWRIQQIIASAVEVETIFCASILRSKLRGMNCELMVQYVKFVADAILKWCGVEPIYNVPNPFDWMKMWGVDGLSSFFEKQVPEYVKGMGLNEQSNRVFQITTEF